MKFNHVIRGSEDNSKSVQVRWYLEEINGKITLCAEREDTKSDFFYTVLHITDDGVIVAERDEVAAINDVGIKVFDNYPAIEWESK